MPSSSLERIVAFLNQIGLATRSGLVPADAFLPGIYIDAGTLVYDAEAMLSPGDLLHEAGHPAVVPPHQRVSMTGDVGEDGMEMAAIAWSYAACVYLGLPPSVVFHEGGYKGDAQHLVETFESGGGIGVPVLQWRELTARDDAPPETPRFPAMQRWLCA
jgi:hypothetical protein